ncbi:RagB/SusD family nutrient uptake outer membrane protein [Pedobacter sp. ASV1-7]|uniref:RagB/SusD family nutrient uptake outer membrane protein n=1 Tax=Pedobacter sp. ASV1-7 TaxID=3145237 RepID=UPI0032E86B9F
MKTFITLFITVLLFSSCDKQNEWLEVKSNKKDVILSTAADYQAVLDNLFRLNYNQASFGMLCTDNVTADLALWQQADEPSRNAYIFAEQILGTPSAPSIGWSSEYSNIASCNIVVEGIQRIRNNVTLAEYNNILGSALFFRANNYFSLTQNFCTPYNDKAINSSLGVPIRRTTDVNEKSVRPILKENYDNILDDLKNAEKLLPDLPAYQTRPSRVSTLALLARVYLTMGKYEESLSCSEKALSIYSELIDYNTLKENDEFVFPVYPNNKEILFFAGSSTYHPLYRYQYTQVNSELYNSYQENDLRKILFFKKGNGGIILLKGQYTGEYSMFSGFATNELYLMKAECQARLGFTELAMETINYLLKNRWRKNTFVPLPAINADAALHIILDERRKEIPFLSNMRWQDLRRLNQEPRFAKKIVHRLDNVDYVLEPNSPKYVFDIPFNEIEYSGIQQNIR